MSRIQKVSFAALFFFGQFAATLCAEDPVQLSPQPGLVLLRNGQVLSGKITRAGDRIMVWLPDGEIRLDLAQVDLICRDLEDGYQKKRARVEPGRAEGHFELAEWCMLQKLWPQAVRELEEARLVDPRHPKVALYERRLNLAFSQPREPLPEALPEADAGPSIDELDRLVREMPQGTVETFTQKIQPLLVNQCSTAGCHGPRSETRLSLLRSSAQRVPNRRLTQRNLYTILQWIDPKQSEASPLLIVPLAPHGGAKVAVFTNPEHWQYQQLVQWVQQATGKPKLSPVATAVVPVSEPPPDSQELRTGLRELPPVTNAVLLIPPGDPNLEKVRDSEGPAVKAPRVPNTPPFPRRISPKAGVPSAGHLPDAADPFGVLRSPTPEHQVYPTINDLPHRSEPKRGEIKSAFEPVDPFDPEIFNRRFLRDRPAGK